MDKQKSQRLGEPERLMTRKGAALREAISVLGVVRRLVFVGFQLQQATPWREWRPTSRLA